MQEEDAKDITSATPEPPATTAPRTAGNAPPNSLIRPAAGISRSGDAGELGTNAPQGEPAPPEAIVEQAPEATPEGYRPNVAPVADAEAGAELARSPIGMVRVERTAGHKLEGLPVVVNGRYQQIPLDLATRIFDADPITARFLLEERGPDGSPYFIERPGEGPTRALAEGETLKK